MWKMYNKTIIEFGFRMISWIRFSHDIMNYQNLVSVLSQITQTSVLIIHDTSLNLIQ